MPEQIALAEETAGPRVSAVLVSYNQAEGLRRAIQALEQSRDREKLEILVVDCGSQDDSSRLDAEFPAINVLRLPHHFGATKAMNIATRTAKADLIFFQAPSVEVQPDTIPKLAAALEEDAETTAAGPLLLDSGGQPVSKFARIPAPGIIDAVAPPPALDPDFNQDSVVVEYPGLLALLVRKQFIRGMNYFDERHFGHYWADADLAMQSRRAGKKIRLYPSIHATLHPEADPLEGDPLADADRTLGAAAFLSKYYGFFTGLGFRLTSIFKALGRFDLRLVGYLVRGQKLDGTQSG